MSEIFDRHSDQVPFFVKKRLDGNFSFLPKTISDCILHQRLQHHSHSRYIQVLAFLHRNIYLKIIALLLQKDIIFYHLDLFSERRFPSFFSEIIRQQLFQCTCVFSDILLMTHLCHPLDRIQHIQQKMRIDLVNQLFVFHLLCFLFLLS